MLYIHIFCVYTGILHTHARTHIHVIELFLKAKRACGKDTKLIGSVSGSFIQLIFKLPE